MKPFIITGQIAKQVLQDMKNPNINRELLERCKAESDKIKRWEAQHEKLPDLCRHIEG